MSKSWKTDARRQFPSSPLTFSFLYLRTLSVHFLSTYNRPSARDVLGSMAVIPGHGGTSSFDCVENQSQGPIEPKAVMHDYPVPAFPFAPVHGVATVDDVKQLLFLVAAASTAASSIIMHV
jgi:hypothetical protein